MGYLLGSLFPTRASGPGPGGTPRARGRPGPVPGRPGPARPGRPAAGPGQARAGPGRARTGPPGLTKI